MNVEIFHCNNIEHAKIEIHENKLNIKYAPNGTGKSSIAKAVYLGTHGDKDALLDLMPFRLRMKNLDKKQPRIEGIESLKTIMCFNEDYVSQFVFKPDELLSNSFEILIRSDKYKQIEQEIETLVRNIKQLFLDNEELEALISTLRVMGGAFTLTKTGISKSSTGMKALSAGNKIEHVPPGLEAYSPFIKSQNSVSWIDWQTKGCAYVELSNGCPFCTESTDGKLEQIKKVGQEYDKAVIKNLLAIIDVIAKLGDYFSVDTKKTLEEIVYQKDGLESQHVVFLAAVKGQIDSFIVKLEKLKSLSGFQFKEDEKVAKELPKYRLDLTSYFSHLESDKMLEAIKPINEAIDEVIKQAGELQGRIGQQRGEIRKNIERHQDSINAFLACAGYRYTVQIAGEGEGAQLKLRHADYKDYVSGGSQHLSFGERNAFAIVLFMHECLAKKPDLIILDDPISSFDTNKKYAILEMLFRKDAEFCEPTPIFRQVLGQNKMF